MDIDTYNEQPPQQAALRRRLLAAAIAVAVLGGVVAAIASLGFSGRTAPQVQAVQAEATGIRIVRPNGDVTSIARAHPVLGVSVKKTALVESWGYPSAGKLVSVKRLYSRAAVDEGKRTAQARVEISSASLFGGMIKLRNISMQSTAAVKNDEARGSITLSQGTELTISGHRVTIRPNQQLRIPGYGTLSLNEQAVVSMARSGDKQTGPRYRSVGAAVHFRLTHAVAGLPAGSDIEIGYIESGVRDGAVSGATPSSIAAASRAVSPGSNGRGTPGTPKPGTTSLPRSSTSVRANTQNSGANLQGYTFPVLGESGYSNDWGAPRSQGWTHQGNDIFAKEGTPLVAVADGVLDRVGWNSVGGYRLWLWDDFGNGFYYAHNSAFSPLARDGARVRAGDVLAFVGHTGDAMGTPDHVHFEVHPNGGAATNPFPFLNAWRRGVAVPALSNLIAATAPGKQLALPSLVLVDIADISANGALSGSPSLEVRPSARLPVGEENTAKKNSETLKEALAGSGIDGS